MGTQNETNTVLGPSGLEIHRQGLIELLRLRGLEHYAREDGQNLSWVIFHTVVSTASSRLLSLSCSNGVLCAFVNKSNPMMTWREFLGKLARRSKTSSRSALGVKLAKLDKNLENNM